MEITISNLFQIQKLASDILKKSLEKKERPIVLALRGELGAGKTAFTKALAKELGIKETITSPTFLLMRVLKLPRKKSGLSHLVHIDAYRIKRAKELLDLGLKEILKDKGSIVVIEWSEKLKRYLPKHTIFINFEIIGEKERKITLF